MEGLTGLARSIMNVRKELIGEKNYVFMKIYFSLSRDTFNLDSSSTIEYT